MCWKHAKSVEGTERASTLTISCVRVVRDENKFDVDIRSILLVKYVVDSGQRLARVRERVRTRMRLVRCLTGLSKEGGKEKVSTSERSRRWQLTENNATYTKEEGANLIASIGETSYVVSCCEMGERGTKHIHIFVIYKNAISLGSIKKHFPRAHLESCKGSNIQNRAYVVKDDSEYFESGVMPVASASDRKRDEASEVMELLVNGVTLQTILMEYKTLNDYVVRNYKNLREIQNDFARYTPKRKR